MFLIFAEFSKACGGRAVCCARQGKTRYRFGSCARLVPLSKVLGMVAVIAGLTCVTCFADEGESPVFAQPLFLRHLQRPVTLTWRGVPIHSSLKRLGNVYQIAVVVDRRVDPERTLNLSAQESALLRVLVAAAVQLDLHAEVIGPTVYIGPENSTRLGPLLLEIARAKIAKLPNRRRAGWDSREPVQIDRLGEPRAIIERMCASRNVTLANPTKIPHDLWDAQTWPSLTLPESLTLLLLGFDMTFDVTAMGECRIRPIDRTKRVAHVHAVKLRAAHRPALKSAFPDVVFSDGGIDLTANLETHADLRDWVRRTRNTDNAATVKNRPAPLVDVPRSYSIEIKNQPLKPIATGLFGRLGMDVEFDDVISTETLQQNVSFKVANASFDEMVSAMLKEVDLTFTVDGTTVRIHPQ